MRKMPRLDPTPATNPGPYVPIPNGWDADRGCIASLPERLNLSNPGKGLIMMTLKLRKLFKNFRADDSGAVTVDWVVLTAAIVGLGMVVMKTVGGGIQTLGDSIVTDLQGRASGYENQ